LLTGSDFDPALTCIIGARLAWIGLMIFGVDPVEVHAGRRPIRMPELPLDDRSWHAFARQLDSVSVAELVLVLTSAQAPSSRPDG
jgi:hypothetical protein